MKHQISRRQFVIAAAIAPGLAWAQGKNGGPPQAGVDYVEVKPPQPTDSGSKIEVIDFFWYGCPHCAAFSPDLEAWRKTLPADVAFRRVPVAFDDPHRLSHSKIFYTLEQLGKEDAMHTKMFTALVNDRKPMEKPEEIADFMAANGIDRKQWMDAFNSFSVATKANRAATLWKAYKIEGTPSLAVDGKYVTSPSMVGSREGSIKVLDVLVQKARASKKA